MGQSLTLVAPFEAFSSCKWTECSWLNKRSFFHHLPFTRSTHRSRPPALAPSHPSLLSLLLLYYIWHVKAAKTRKLRLRNKVMTRELELSCLSVVDQDPLFLSCFSSVFVFWHHFGFSSRLRMPFLICDLFRLLKLLSHCLSMHCWVLHEWAITNA